MQKLKRLFSVIMTIIITFLMIYGASRWVERKESRLRYKDFFDHAEEYDVLFFGTSHTINAVYPWELWDDYGIASYNMGSHGAPIITSYWIAMNALDYAYPKLIVLDCYYIASDIKKSEDYEQVHKPFDAFPLSLNKIKAVNDMFEGDDTNNKYDVLWNFILYHNRWNQLEKWDYTMPYNKEKGGETRIGYTKPLVFDKVESSEKLTEDYLSVDYVKEFANHCKSKGIEVLFIYTPFPADDNKQREANMVADVADKLGVDYLNFLDMPVVNLNTDMYDEDSHLNPSGAKKVTSYIGQYIKDNYDIPDRRGTEEYSKWQKGYEEYYTAKKNDFLYNSDPYEYMVLMKDKDLSIECHLYNDEIMQDNSYLLLFDNLDIVIKNIEDNPYEAEVDLKLIVRDKDGEFLENALFNYDSGNISLIKDYYE